MTSPQRKVYDAIKKYWLENNMPPTVRDLMELTGDYSPATVQVKLKALRSEGLIDWRPRKARWIKLTNVVPGQ